MSSFHLAIDGNEANTNNRVGSNVYAFHLLREFFQIIEETAQCEVTVLLADQPIADLPPATAKWHYRVITPRRFWTQLAAPWHFYTHQYDYDVLFTPSHYAPRFCCVPYVSTVMDLAFLDYPEQFKRSDLIQLTNWTKYSVMSASKVITISSFTKQEVIKHYSLDPQSIIVAHPSVSFPEHAASKAELVKFLMEHQIKQPYFLYLGTLQPRKNIINLVAAYELFCDDQASNKKGLNALPQLVLAGKQGWLAEPILDRIRRSKVCSKIILTGFIEDSLKPQLYQSALATLLVGFYEGFGIPPLESIHFGTLPIVSNTSSLPEVVGDAGLLVNPYQPQSIADAMSQVFLMPNVMKKRFQQKMLTQRAKFNWHQTAETICHALSEVVNQNLQRRDSCI